jgi:hypothetical protein
MNLFENYQLTESQKKELLEAFESQVSAKVKQLEERKQEEIDIAVDAALKAFDEDVTNKTKKLLESLDDDVLSKTKMLVNHIIKDKTQKLKKVKTFYESELKKKAKRDFDTIVEKLDSYLETILVEEIPNIHKKINEAAKNTHAAETLSKLQESLKVTVMPEEVKKAVKESQNLKAKNKELLLENARAKGAKYLEMRISNLPSALQKHMRVVCSDRSESFIRENFDFLVKQFQISESKKVKSIGESLRRGNTSGNFGMINENQSVPKSLSRPNPRQTNNVTSDPVVDLFAKALKQSKY